ncbi:hypothetical protein [Nonomuraea sp. NPDC001699]
MDWHYGIGLVDRSSVTDRDRAVYARVYEGTLPQVATGVRDIVTVDKALHWLCEEDPELVSRSSAQFFA